MMDYKIVEKPRFSFVGVSARVPMQFEGVNQAIVTLAQSITEQQREEMHRLQNEEPYEIVNISYNSDTNFMQEAGELTHMIGVLSTHKDIDDSLLEEKKMPEGLWAVFPNQGPFPMTMQKTMADIYAKWLQTSDYQLADSLSFSFTKLNESQDEAYCEIWIPVKNK